MSPQTGVAPGRTRRTPLLAGVLLALLAVTVLTGPRAAAAATTTIGQPGHITLTAPTTVDAGGEALLDLNYTNVSGLPVDSATVTVTFAPEADGSLSAGSFSWWSPDPEHHTDTVVGNAANRTITVTLRDLAPGAANRTVVYVPFKSTASGQAPLSAALVETTPEGPATTDLGGLTIGAVSSANLAVSLDASPKGLGVSHATFTATVTNRGPAATTAARLRFTYPSAFTGPSAQGCAVDAAARTVTCDLGAIPAGGSVTRSMGLYTRLLVISGRLTVTASRLDSAPADPQPSDDTASATCTALTGLLVRC
ncbi:hypothetical protein ACFYSC_10675 [Streptosporangium sp. NPDC004379]|uniref:hypothetical protein n=1 Tax=Streptosporangium sp. NPDC004379 TaxID=3366189 RepID=UPI0036A14F26